MQKNVWPIVIGVVGVAAVLGIVFLLYSRHQSQSYVPQTVGRLEPPATSYSNVEEIELLDFDKDLLMPRKIVVHRKARVE